MGRKEVMVEMGRRMSWWRWGRGCHGGDGEEGVMVGMGRRMSWWK